MEKNLNSNSQSSEFDSGSKKKKSKSLSKQENHKNEKLIQDLRMQISKLSYEESLSKLDILLEKINNQNLPVQDLQQSFLQGSLYIEHCEKLLNKTEQEVLEISLEDLQ